MSAMTLYQRRKLANRTILVLSFVATGIGLGWLALILGLIAGL